MARFDVTEKSTIAARRWVRSLLAGIGAAGIVLGGVLVGTAGAASIVAQAQAQAVNVTVANGGAVIAASNPPTAASSNGTSSNVSQNSPAVSVPASESWLDVGSLSELAAAYATGTSYACAGIAQPGGALQVGTGGNCYISGGSGNGVSLDLSALPDVGAALSDVASVSIRLDAVTAFAEATPGGSIGSVNLANGEVVVTLAGDLQSIDIPLNLSTAPDESLLSEVVASLNAQPNPSLQSLASTLAATVAPAVQIITNYQVPNGTGLRVTGVHLAALGDASASVGFSTADLATVWVGPNASGGTSGGTATNGPPAISAINPNAGPTTGGTFVTISGSNLSDASMVTFGDAPANFVVNSDGSLTAVSPAGSGTVPVVASGPSGTSAQTPADLFTYYAGGSVPGGAGAANGGIPGSAGAASCPSGEVISGYSYTFPLRVEVTDTKVHPGSSILGRITEGDRIVVSTAMRMPSSHRITISDTTKSDGLLTGEIVENHRVVLRVPVPLSAPSTCVKASAAAKDTETYIARVPQFAIGTRIAGAIYVKSTLVQHFAVQVYADHLITFVDHSPVTGGVAKFFRPGGKGAVFLTVRGVTS